MAVASTGTAAPARARVSAGVAAAASTVDADVISTDSGTSPPAPGEGTRNHPTVITFAFRILVVARVTDDEWVKVDMGQAAR
jgi:hypothetical protein